MKKIVLIILFIFISTQINNNFVKEIIPINSFTIGRFNIIQTDQGYKAYTDKYVSGYHFRAINAIREISNK